MYVVCSIPVQNDDFVIIIFFSFLSVLLYMSVRTYNIMRRLSCWGTILRVFQQYIPQKATQKLYFILFIFILPQFRSRDMNLLNIYVTFTHIIRMYKCAQSNNFYFAVCLYGIVAVIFRRENTPQFPVICFYSLKYNSVLKCFWFFFSSLLLFILDLTDFLYRM